LWNRGLHKVTAHIQIFERSLYPDHLALYNQTQRFDNLVVLQLLRYLLRPRHPILLLTSLVQYLALQAAVYEEERLRWLIEGAKLKVSVWQSLGANQRAEAKSL
jgi:hypothetical protein